MIFIVTSAVLLLLSGSVVAEDTVESTDASLPWGPERVLLTLTTSMLSKTLAPDARVPMLQGGKGGSGVAAVPAHTKHTLPN